MTTDGRSGLDAGAIEGRITGFLQRELGLESAVGRDDDLLSGGVLDSIGVLRLAAFVAEEFHVEIRPGDFVVENFRTIAVLTGYVARATAPAGRPPADDTP